MDNFSKNVIAINNLSPLELRELIREIVENVVKPIKDDIAALKGETVYTLRQAAKRLNKHETTIYRYCKSGKIKATKRGQSYIIKHTDLQKLIDG